jgi:hypothetical protein
VDVPTGSSHGLRISKKEEKEMSARTVIAVVFGSFVTGIVATMWIGQIIEEAMMTDEEKTMAEISSWEQYF